MIIQEQVKDVVVIGDDTSKKAKISQDKLAKLQYLLTKGLYKDPITAVIAEWTNNGIDSVVQAGKDPIENPVLVKIERDIAGQHIFSVEDKGVGLDNHDFEDICMNYLESTKENDNDTIGHFGIGMKSFLSLERSASFICRKNGVERKYLVYEGAEFVNYDLVYEKSTAEENGVKAELVINGWSEKNLFVDKAKQKLAYYDTAVLIIDGNIIESKIFRSEDFQYSSLSTSSNIHICLKDVYYAIDWEALGIKPIDVRIGLRMSLSDGITPTPSRESYITNEKTKQLILDKIQKVANWFVEKYNDNVKEFDTFLDAYEHLGVSAYNVKVGDSSFYINPLVNYATTKIVTPKVKGITQRDAVFYKKERDHLLTGYQISAYLDDYGTMKNAGRRLWVSKDNYIMQDEGKTVLVKSPFAGNVKEFLKQKYKKSVLFVSDSGFRRKLGGKKGVTDYESYYSILQLFSVKKHLWRKHIEEFNFVTSTIVSTFIDETDVTSDPAFIKWMDDKKEAQKQKRLLGIKNGTYKGLNKQLGDVTLAYSYKSIRGISFKKEAFPIANLHKNHFVTVLIEEGDDIEKIKEIIPGFNFTGSTVKFATVGKKESKKIPECSQFINVKKFMSRDCKPFSRLASAIVFQKALEELDSVKKYKSEVFRKFVSHLHKDEIALRDYVNKNMAYLDDKAKTAILEVADENKLYDYSLWDVYTRIKEGAKKYDFINLLAEPPYYNKEMQERYQKLINQILLFRMKYYNDLPEGTKIVIEK